MSKNISRGELIKVTTELLAADLNAHRQGGAPRSTVVGYFKNEETIRDIVEIAAAMIKVVDVFFFDDEDDKSKQ